MIYVLRVQNQRKGFFKVGFSTNPANRIPDIQTNCPFKLSLVSLRPGSLKDEKALHRQLEYFKTTGEWFKDTPEVRNVLKISSVHQEIKKDFVSQADWFKVAIFLENNKDFSYDANMLCNCLDVNIDLLKKFYHNKRFDSPFRIESVNESDATKVNLVGMIKSGEIISHTDLFTPILGAYDKFWQGPIRVTPFNQKNYPGKPLGSTTW